MKFAYCNATLLDGTKDMEPVQGMTVLTDGEKIVDIVPAQSSYPGYEVVDLKGKYLLPGLINLHIHIPGSGQPKDKPTDTKKLVKLMTSCGLTRFILQKMCEGYVKQQVLSGTTTVRAVGGVEFYDSLVRDRILRNEIIGPRILAANMAVSVPGGHMAGSLAYEAHSAEEAANFVETIAKDQPDLIKLMITGGVLDAKVKGEPGELKMMPELVKAACDKAHEHGLMVAAHVESPEGVRVALENGVDTIEHGAKPDEEILRLFKERNAALVATLSPALPYALFPREVSKVSEMEQFNGQVVFNGIIECAKVCLENGVPVGLGTDTGCPYVTHTDMWREVNYFHKYCGVSNAFALHTATLGNARIAHIDDVTGSIEKGKSADMIVVEKNPLDSLSALRHVTMVVTRGNLIRNPKVKKSAVVEEALEPYV